MWLSVSPYVHISTHSITLCGWCKHNGEINSFKNILNILVLIYIIGFDLRMKGAGLACQPHYQLWVQSMDYGAYLVEEFLSTHCQNQQDSGLGEQWNTPSHPTWDEQQA